MVSEINYRSLRDGGNNSPTIRMVALQTGEVVLDHQQLVVREFINPLAMHGFKGLDHLQLHGCCRQYIPATPLRPRMFTRELASFY